MKDIVAYKTEIIAEVLIDGKWVSNPDPTFVHRVYSSHFNGEFNNGRIPVKEEETLGHFKHPCNVTNTPWFILLGCKIDFSDLPRSEFQCIKQRGKPDQPSKRWKRILKYYSGLMSCINHVYIDDFDAIDWEARVTDNEYSITGFQNLLYDNLFEDQQYNTIEPFRWLNERYDKARLVYGFVKQEYELMGRLCIDIQEDRFIVPD